MSEVSKPTSSLHAHIWATRYFTDGVIFHSWRCCQVCKKMIPAKGRW